MTATGVRLATAIIALAWIAFWLFWVISATGALSARRLRTLVLSILLLVSTAALFILFRSATIPGEINMILWHRSLASIICSDLVVLAGLVIVIQARRTLGSNWSGKVEIGTDHELIQSGLYKYVRHPIYSGFLTMVLGTALAYGRLLGVLMLVILVVGFSVKALREEALLETHFGEEYSRYKAKTKALIPFLF